MLDIGWSEFLVIGVVALVVVGPKDLPVMFRTLGRFTAKARNMSREFTRAMEAAAKESGVGDVAKDLKSVTSARSLGLDSLQNAATRFEKWDPLKKSTTPKPDAAKVSLPPGDQAVVVPEAGPNTAALAVRRAEERAAVIQSAQSAADARTGGGAAKTAIARKAKVAKPAGSALVSQPAAAAAKPVPLSKAKAKPKAATAVVLAAPAADAGPKNKAKSGAKVSAPGPAASAEQTPPVAKRTRKAPAKTGDA